MKKLTSILSNSILYITANDFSVFRWFRLFLAYLSTMKHPDEHLSFSPHLNTFLSMCDYLVYG